MSDVKDTERLGEVSCGACGGVGSFASKVDSFNPSGKRSRCGVCGGSGRASPADGKAESIKPLRCETQNAFGADCQLPRGHSGMHRAEGGGRKLAWCNADELADKAETGGVVRGFGAMPEQDVTEAWVLEVNFDGYGYRPDEVFATEELATAALQAFRGGGIAGARVRKWSAYEAGQQSRLDERERAVVEAARAWRLNYYPLHNTGTIPGALADAIDALDSAAKSDANPSK